MILGKVIRSYLSFEMVCGLGNFFLIGYLFFIVVFFFSYMLDFRNDGL